MSNKNSKNAPFLVPRSVQSIEGVKTPLTSQQEIELQKLLSKSNPATTSVDNDARPSKEDSIWVYKCDGDRLISSQQQNMDDFLSNVKRGRFSGGSDPLA